MECWQNMPSIDEKHGSQYDVGHCNVGLNKGLPAECVKVHSTTYNAFFLGPSYREALGCSLVSVCVRLALPVS